MRHSKRKEYWALLMVIPCLALYVCIQIVPLAESGFYSFFSWKGIGPMTWVGLDNYKKLFTEDLVMRIALKNTILFSVISLLLCLPLSFFSAHALTQKIRFVRTYSTILYIPGVLSTVIVAIMWGAILNPETGPINIFLKSIGLSSMAKVWLGEPVTAFYSVILVNLWQWFGYHMLIFYVSLQTIPEELYEAAGIDGANGKQKLWYVTLPLMQSSIKMNAMLITIGSLKCFEIVYTMTSGGPADTTQMLATYMYHNTFRRFHFGYGSAISIVIFVLCITVSLIFQSIKTDQD